MREFIRNNQPHFQNHDTSYSITILLWDAITLPELNALRDSLIDVTEAIENDALDRKELRKSEARSRNFEQLELLLHDKRHQSYLLRNPAAITAGLKYFQRDDRKLYNLHAVSIMPNHVHLLLDLGPQSEHIIWPIDKLVGRLKGGSAFAINKALNRKGKLWMLGYHDRYTRSTIHFEWAKNYILRNPEKAGLVEIWMEHIGTWSR